MAISGLRGSEEVNWYASTPQDPEKKSEKEEQVDFKTILEHPVVKKLSAQERDVVQKILDKVPAQNCERKQYYLGKLKLLLDTPYEDPTKAVSGGMSFEEKNLDGMRRETLRVAAMLSKVPADEREVFQQREEDLWRSVKKSDWEIRKGCGAHYVVYRKDPNNLMVRVAVCVHADPKIQEAIFGFEDAIEKYLSIPGFNVDLKFVKPPVEDSQRELVFNVNADPAQWASSCNWIGSYETVAHEMVHLLGLDDEYDKIEAHADNKHLTRHRRLEIFLQQMDRIPPLDCGIMSGKSRPLPREVREMVGLPIDDDTRQKAGVQISNPKAGQGK
ncbi:MAG: hypothetical protein A2341_22550 [Deltaproteobacteria bacterium RIFOXYB12_FULL_58_9]|nr:MAG: hypothetical protein A2341_22550 [Deltaproteobacteria bacterium RIFOXYB12_FULL_58_9]